MTDKEYLLQVKVKNNLLYSAIKQKGYDSIPKFAKDHGLHYEWLISVISMSKSIFTKKGDYSGRTLKLCEVLGKGVDELFTDNQKYSRQKIQKNIEVAEKEIDAYCTMLESSTSTQLNIEERIDLENLSDVHKRTLETLTPREQKIINMRFGLIDGVEHTLEDCAIAENVGKERIRQIELKALRKIRHPSRARNYIGYDDEVEDQVKFHDEMEERRKQNKSWLE